ncbi:MAG: hypothetical protein P1U57_07310, partial [Oleibacter sp.]|nr:hypothetical protein [Thalassolituus sp.]
MDCSPDSHLNLSKFIKNIRCFGIIYTFFALGISSQVQAEAVVDKSFSLNAFIGTSETEVSFSNESGDITNLNGIELYRSSEPSCDLADFTACADNQSDILSGNDVTNPITDTAAILTRTGYYKFKEGRYQSDEIAIDASNTADFSARLSHQTVSFPDPNDNNKLKLWIVGGTSGAVASNDVRSSSDGVRWKLITDNAAFSARFDHQVVVFPDPNDENKNKLWLIGGNTAEGFKNDIWSSTDGITWTEVNASSEFPVRSGHQVVVFPDPDTGAEKLWLIGGGNDSVPYLNDVWSSFDGITWTEVNASADFPARTFHQVVAFTDANDGNNLKLWLLGGTNGSSLNDVWKSSNGSIWEPVQSNTIFSERFAHQVVVYPNPDTGLDNLWLIGGDTSNGLINDVWSTADGALWNEETDSADFSARYGHQLVIFPDPSSGDDQLWVIGGADSSSQNDVWKSANGKAWMLAFQNTVTFTPTYYDVTASVTGGNGKVDPESQSIVQGGKASFEITPAVNFQLDSVSGCGGLTSGLIYTTEEITADCVVEATFSAIEFEVTATSIGNGTITPETQTIAQGSTAVFTVTPDANNQIVSVTGCDGTLVDNTYTTGEITAACAVEATFSAIEVEVTATSIGNGTITPETQTIAQGSTAVFTVTP